jgi:hypothetical protein
MKRVVRERQVENSKDARNYKKIIFNGGFFDYGKEQWSMF